MKMCARRKRHRPSLELLEPRITPSNIGVNLTFNYLTAGQDVWVDVGKLFGAWGAPVGPTGSATGPAPAVNADNYPLAPASTGARLGSYPDGDYQLSYQGTGIVTFSGIGYLAGPVTTNSDGVSTGTVVIDHDLGAGSFFNGTLLDMTVTGVSPTATISNFHLYSPGYGSNPTQMFTNAFLQTLKPFSTIRFVQWNNVVDSTASTWASRALPTSFSTTGTMGVPYEDIIELANESQKDMWINIPALATPDYVQNLAQLIYSNLDPNLNVYVEYSDETWNGGFYEYSQVLQLANSNPLVTAPDSTHKIQQESAYQIVSIGQTFDSVFGSSNARVRPVVGAFVSTPNLTSQVQLQFIQANYGTPSKYVYGVGIAPYVLLPTGDDVAGLTLNRLFTDINQSLATTYVSSLQANVAVASSFGLPLLAYEGGTDLSPGSKNVNAQVKLEAQSDPRMYQVFTTMMNDWNTYVGSKNLFVQYTLASPYTDDQFYGALQYVNDPGSEKYDALVSETELPGDANFDGIVNFADFQILAQNYGLSNTWWQQGDFNGQGVTNWSDLNLLRTNLDPTSMTLAQFAQVALFGQPSVLTVGQASEYDGYGVTDVSQMPWVSSSNGQGAVRLNTTSSGAPISLGGIIYSNGLGVYANSNVTLNLAGQYSVFQSQIGVPAAFPTSSVIFQVFGDGQLLYQSPVVTSASGAVPLNVNVAGVQQLSLAVIASTGSTTGDSAVWVTPRLISTSNFSQRQVSPYTLTWTVSTNGQTLLTQTSDSFAFTYPGPGVYTVGLTVTDASGSTASASDTVTVNAASASANLIAQDTTTQGTWIGHYGTQGYDVVGNTVSLNNFGTVSPSGESTLTWATSTTDTRALENAGGTTGRVAAAWSSSTSFSVNLNLTDGSAHDIALYAVDWDNQGRSEQIQISNAATGEVLDTESISGFSGGVYLDWRISGNVIITVTRLSGPNAVLSGLFLDAPPVAATLVRQDGTTGGAWIGNYGSQGYDPAGTPASIPSYATVTVSGARLDVDSTSAIENAALEEASGNGRYLGDWSSTTQFSITVNLTDGQPHDLTLYAEDWASEGRSEDIQIANAATGAILSVKSLSNFDEGAYLQWMVTGSVVITVSKASGTNAVLSGLFFDPPSSLSALQASTATLAKQDSTTEGNWIGNYGSDGYNIVGNAVSYPAYVRITPVNTWVTTWASSTTNTLALQDAGDSGRQASYWSSWASIDVALMDGGAHDIGVYVLNWNNTPRNETIQVTDGISGALLDTETVSTVVAEGIYFQWVVTGNVVITFTGMSATVSGLFFDPPSAAASLVKQDATTQGNWIGSYGTEGYNAIGNASSYPAYVIVQPAGQSTNTWAASTTDPRALQTADGSDRQASDWYSTTSFTIGVDLTDGQPHDIALYALDWDNMGRSEQVQITDASTGAMLDTQTLSKFSQGVYLEWRVFGDVVITITNLAGPSAVVSGLFIDPSSGSAADTIPTTASFTKLDTTTSGNWIGVYGSQGYNDLGSGVSNPTYATITPAGQSLYTWAAPALSVTQALQVPPTGTSRIAAAWYSATSFAIDVNVAAGHSYNLELYFLDYDARGRAETVTLSNANTGATLNSQSMSNFTSGKYLVWTISGNVLITISHTGGANAVLNGLFFDPAGSSPPPPLRLLRLLRLLCRLRPRASSVRTRGRRETGSMSTATRATTSWAAV